MNPYKFSYWKVLVGLDCLVMFISATLGVFQNTIFGYNTRWDAIFILMGLTVGVLGVLWCKTDLKLFYGKLKCFIKRNGGK